MSKIYPVLCMTIFLFLMGGGLSTRVKAAEPLVPCIGVICLGDPVRVDYGPHRDETGTVIQISFQNRLLTLLGTYGYTFRVSADDVVPVIFDRDRECTGGICRGDEVIVLDIRYGDPRGVVLSTNDSNYTALVQVQGTLMTVGIRRLVRTSDSRAPRPRDPSPIPQPPRRHPNPPRRSPVPQPPRPRY